MTSYSGYILAWTKKEPVSWDVLHSEGGIGRAGALFTHDGTAFGLRQWHRFMLETGFPIDEEESVASPPFIYPTLCVTSGARMILLCHKKKIADWIITNVFDKNIYPNLRKVPIRIDSLIESCRSIESDYQITILHGRNAVTAEKELASISLYGEDITRSGLFIKSGHTFNFFSCGVTKRQHHQELRASLADEGGTVQLGNDGFISASVAKRTSALEVMRVVQYVMRNGWVDSWVPRDEGTS